MFIKHGRDVRRRQGNMLARRDDFGTRCGVMAPGHHCHPQAPRGTSSSSRHPAGNFHGAISATRQDTYSPACLMDPCVSRLIRTEYSLSKPLSKPRRKLIIRRPLVVWHRELLCRRPWTSDEVRQQHIVHAAGPRDCMGAYDRYSCQVAAAVRCPSACNPTDAVEVEYIVVRVPTCMSLPGVHPAVAHIQKDSRTMLQIPP